MYVNGEMKTIVVDDQFPFNERSNKWAFSRTTKTNEIWVLILEKAWAKIFGSYQRIEAGLTGEALQPLTGCPEKMYKHDQLNADQLWKHIQSGDKASFVMCTSTFSAYKDDLTTEEMDRAGLVDGHAYSLLNVKVITVEGKQVQLV